MPPQSSHFGPLPPGVPQRRSKATQGRDVWPPGVYWTISYEDGGIVILDRYRLPVNVTWRRTSAASLMVLRSPPQPNTHTLQSTTNPKEPFHSSPSPF